MLTLRPRLPLCHRRNCHQAPPSLQHPTHISACAVNRVVAAMEALSMLMISVGGVATVATTAVHPGSRCAVCLHLTAQLALLRMQLHRNIPQSARLQRTPRMASP